MIWPAVHYFPAWFEPQVRSFKWGNAVSCILMLAACLALRKFGGRSAFVSSPVVCQVGLAMLAANLLLNLDLLYCLPQTGHACLFALGVAFLLMSASRVLFGVAFSVALVCSLADAVCRAKFGIVPDRDIIMQVLDAHMTEVSNYLPDNVVLILVVALLGIALWMWWVLRAVRRETRLRLLGSGLLFLALGMAARQCSIPPDCKRDCAEWPRSLLRRTIKEVVKASDDNRRMVRSLMLLPHASEKPVSISTLHGGEGVVCILHIGESVRADHMTIYGYGRNTTPWLASRHNLIKMDRCVSLAPYTIFAFISIMTDSWGSSAGSAVLSYREPTTRSVTGLLSAGGFKNCTFCEDEMVDKSKSLFRDNAFCQLLNLFTEGGEMVTYHRDPMNQVQQIHDKVRQEPAGNFFCLVNNIGSHIPFRWYDKEHPAFTPTSEEARNNDPAQDKEMAQAALNAYDNTIRYTDEYIRRLLSGLEHRPVIYIYVGDHGEYVGDDGGRWGRGNVSADYLQTKACQVPFIVYATPEFEALHPHFREALEQLRANQGVPVSQDYVFHTLLGIFGISADCYKEEYDMSSKRLQPFSGVQPGSPDPPPIQGDTGERTDKAS